MTDEDDNTPQDIHEAVPMSEDLEWPHQAARIDDTRRNIAYALLALLGFVMTLSLVLVSTGTVAEPAMKDLLEIMIPTLATLTGTAFGFFFGQGARSHQ